ncbi:hypothetical protein DMJ13_22585 [halophilic archaeon]|nr:hypothetical protein DMJ13_22585 [halophilic archaeon]
MDSDASPPDVAVQSFLAAVIGSVGFLLFVGVSVASNAAVGLSNASRDTLAVPQWLYLATGGATIGASALLASVVTDRAFVRSLHNWHARVSVQPTFRQAAVTATRILGIAGLAIIFYRGVVGPQIPTVNVAVILVFAGVRAGLTMVVYLVGNIWPLLNPWRTIANLLPTLNRRYPSCFRRWPAVVGLLLLVWLETVTPINKEPALLAAAVGGYTVVTLVGAIVFTPAVWFEHADPLAVTFRFYGYVAPFRWSGDGLTFHPPGFNLPESNFVKDTSDIAFIIALIWELTFSGFVTTTIGVDAITTVVNHSAPPLVVYALLFVSGYLLFVGAFQLAARTARTRGDTYLTSRTIGIRFAPPLLAIAAGYHLAHYFGFFISLLPAFITAVVSPLSPPVNPIVLTLPNWFGGLTIGFILIGHVLAVWVAHAEAYATFPSRLQAIRSQHSFVLVMIAYTIISLWLVSLSTATPAFVS